MFLFSFKYWTPVHCGKGSTTKFTKIRILEDLIVTQPRWLGKDSGCSLGSSLSNVSVLSIAILQDFQVGLGPASLASCFVGRLTGLEVSACFKIPCIQPYGKHLNPLAFLQQVHTHFGNHFWLLSSSVNSQRLVFVFLTSTVTSSENATHLIRQRGEYF